MRNRRADSKHELGRKLLNTGRRSGNTKSTARCQEEAQFLPIYECVCVVVVVAVAGCEASSLFVVQLEIDKNSTVFLTYIGWLSWRQRFARSSGCPVGVGRLQNHSGPARRMSSQLLSFTIACATRNENRTRFVH